MIYCIRQGLLGQPMSNCRKPESKTCCMALVVLRTGIWRHFTFGNCFEAKANPVNLRTLGLKQLYPFTPAHDQNRNCLKGVLQNRPLFKAQVESMERMAVVAELRDDSTGEHSYRVGRLASLLPQRGRL